MGNRLWVSLPWHTWARCPSHQTRKAQEDKDNGKA
jgi:hypothetical protein